MTQEVSSTSFRNFIIVWIAILPPRQCVSL